MSGSVNDGRVGGFLVLPTPYFWSHSGWRAVRRFTPPAQKLLNLLPGDIGRRLGEIRPNLDVEDLEGLARELLPHAGLANLAGVQVHFEDSKPAHIRFAEQWVHAPAPVSNLIPKPENTQVMGTPRRFSRA